MRARRHGLRRRRRGRHGRDDADTVLPVQRRADRPQRRGAARLLPRVSPGDARLLRQQGVLQPVVPRPRAPRRHRHRGELRRRALEGAPRRLRAAARSSSTASPRRAPRWPRRSRDHRGARRRLRLRAAAHRGCRRRPAQAGPRRAPRRPQRRQRDASRPAHQQGAKAGIDVNEALGAFGLAAQLPNIDLVGMHYHIGSQITRVDPYIEALEAALALLTRIETGARHPPRAPQHRRRLRHPLLRPHRRRAGHVLRGPAHARGLRARDRRASRGGAPGPPALPGAGARDRRQQRHPREPRGGREDEARRGRSRAHLARRLADDRRRLQHDPRALAATTGTSAPSSPTTAASRRSGRSASVARSATAATSTPATRVPTTATCRRAPRSATSSPSSTSARTRSSA